LKADKSDAIMKNMNQD